VEFMLIQIIDFEETNHGVLESATATFLLTFHVVGAELENSFFIKAFFTYWQTGWKWPQTEELRCFECTGWYPDKEACVSFEVTFPEARKFLCTQLLPEDQIFNFIVTYYYGGTEREKAWLSAHYNLQLVSEIIKNDNLLECRWCIDFSSKFVKAFSNVFGSDSTFPKSSGDTASIEKLVVEENMDQAEHRIRISEDEMETVCSDCEDDPTTRENEKFGCDPTISRKQTEDELILKNIIPLPAPDDSVYLETPLDDQKESLVELAQYVREKRSRESISSRQEHLHSRKRKKLAAYSESEKVEKQKINKRSGSFSHASPVISGIAAKERERSGSGERNTKKKNRSFLGSLSCNSIFDDDRSISRSRSRSPLLESITNRNFVSKNSLNFKRKRLPTTHSESNNLQSTTRERSPDRSASAHFRASIADKIMDIGLDEESDKENSSTSKGTFSLSGTPLFSRSRTRKAGVNQKHAIWQTATVKKVSDGRLLASQLVQHHSSLHWNWIILLTHAFTMTFERTEQSKMPKTAWCNLGSKKRVCNGGVFKRD